MLQDSLDDERMVSEIQDVFFAFLREKRRFPDASTSVFASLVDSLLTIANENPKPNAFRAVYLLFNLLSTGLCSLFAYLDGLRRLAKTHAF